jgi:hypothetical protein
MQLIYRGHCYPYAPTAAQSIHQPRVINWRYRLPGTAQFEKLTNNSTVKSPSCLPLAINWRYQIPGEA